MSKIEDIVCNQTEGQIPKISHKDFRKLFKKQRRKKKRQAAAIAEEPLNTDQGSCELPEKSKNASFCIDTSYGHSNIDSELLLKRKKAIRRAKDILERKNFPQTTNFMCY